MIIQMLYRCTEQYLHSGKLEVIRLGYFNIDSNLSIVYEMEDNLVNVYPGIYH